jgi:2-oxoglutarate dehydrogenase E1 component
MNAPPFVTRWNLDAIEDAYRRWKNDPASVTDDWRVFFEGYELGRATQPESPQTSSDSSRVVRLIEAYRDRGHLMARLDPLRETPSAQPLLDLSEFGFTDDDRSRLVDASHFVGLAKVTLGQLLAALQETYCRTIGVEYTHIQDPRIHRWLEERMEPRRNQPNLTRREKLGLLMGLHLAELFEHFLHARYLGQKRFSLEGSETLIPVLDTIVDSAASLGVREMVFGMSHRGRLNVLANILGKPYQEIFAEFEDNYLPDSAAGDGDVKYHQGFSGDRTTSRGEKIHLSLTPNPSHLEAVNPVVEGRTRAKQAIFGDRDRVLGIPLLIHGDAAFAGQGLVAETLNLSQLDGYTTGGTIHIIVNNQIGFTTSPRDARSTPYCTDVAKMIQAPIFHVNAEDPEAAIYIARLALDFRQTFRRDVVIDLICYRRHGHNEGDEPSYTQPVMYAKIKGRPTLSEVYTEQLVLRGDMTADETAAIDATFQEKLRAAQENVKSSPSRRPREQPASSRWQGLAPGYNYDPVNTAVPYDTLVKITDAAAHMPDTFQPHAKILKGLANRCQEIRQPRPVDWSWAETLAFGSLLLEGTPIRLSGQDSRRGTFSQRHVVLFDLRTGDPYTPLNSISADQALLAAFDSPLSETAVLGFDFGYSLDDPLKLILWEAQFGDFANGAQVIIDQFIVCCQSKWQRDSGLVMLLPHGYEGQGPEHSSARLERYLQLCAEDNIQVCNPTTPAQYFHLLRRQMRRGFRKPLIIMTPKSLLRHKQAVSPVEALTEGTFEELLDPALPDPAAVERVVFCSGKIYYDLEQHRQKTRNDRVAILRLEQLYPWAQAKVAAVPAIYQNARQWIWAQEESMNMGAWTFVEPRLRALGCPVAYVGRDMSSSPATGSMSTHRREQREVVEAAISGRAPFLAQANVAAPIATCEETGRDGERDASPRARTASVHKG